MIIEYDKRYDENIKDLFVELQDDIVNMDKEKYYILTENYREEYFKKAMEDIQKYNGKILLCSENNKIVGLIIALTNNEETLNYDSNVPKRGRITELIVSKNYRKKGYGKQLLNSMETYLMKQGCKDILLGVLAYNDHAIQFYEKNGYHARLVEMTKKVKI